MFLCFLIFSLCVSTIKSQSTSTMMTRDHLATTTPTKGPTTTMDLGALYLVAKPDYPVAAGQTVQLDCITMMPSQNIMWSRYHLQNQNWENVGWGKVLLLTEPKESGKYRCETSNIGNVKPVSQNHTVYIVSISTTGDQLGKAAFALCILILVVIIVGLVWFCWERFGNNLSALNAPKKDVPPPPEVVPKGLPPTSDSDGDVYMNYTSTTQPYTDLNPSNMTGEEFYSTLS